MKYRKNEKGAALLLALGFAALLLVLIMGFATNALIERKVASNNADRTEAKSIAISALNRSIAAMQYQMMALANLHVADSGIYRFDNIVSKYSNNTNALNFNSFSGNTDPEFSGMDEIFVHRNEDFILNGAARVNFTGSNRTYGLKNGADLYIYKYPLASASGLHYDYNENKSNAVSLQEIILRQPQWQYFQKKN